MWSSSILQSFKITVQYATTVNYTNNKNGIFRVIFFFSDKTAKILDEKKKIRLKKKYL